MSKRTISAAFVLIGAFGLTIGVLAGYIWGGWYEWEKGYRYAVRQMCAGNVETLRSVRDTLSVGKCLSGDDTGFRRK